MAKKVKTVKVKKKRKLNVRSLFTKLFSVALLALSGFLIYLIVNEVKDTLRLSQEYDLAKEKLALVQLENQQLTEQVEKLQDPDYIRNYVRGEYFFSNPGEQVFHLPGLNDEESEP
ncbi:MAG: septum formation initiator family protein [Erysipelotrichaceae bacterium]|jgi:cell division protein DivIC|nr:septum formation initiator family protein [Erysipelotrichaceae bacterium]